MRKQTSKNQLNARRPKSRSKDQLIYQICEPRNLLAGIFFGDGELTIGGSDQNDTASVTVSGTTLTASLSGFESQEFTASEVTQINFIGLDGDDSFTNGSSIPSSAFGLGGNDTLIGGSGPDILVGGTGADTIMGEDGDDTLRGGIAPGDDMIFGGAGNDKIFGSTGSNEIHGGDGADVIFAAGEVDVIFGDAGDDEIFPGHGENEVHGGEGDDLIIGGEDADEIFGDDGNDRIFSGPGDDVVSGGNGDDRILGFEGDDTITAGAGDDVIFGLDGDDTIDAGADNDFISGGEGVDNLVGGNGDDELRGFAGDDTIDGGAGNDRVIYHRVRSQYRVFNSSPLFVSNTGNGDEGRDTINNAERLIFVVRDANGNGVVDENIKAEADVAQRVTIQPIIVSNTNGSNTAEYFGDAASRIEIQAEINHVFAQNQRVGASGENRSIDVRWSAARTWNNSFANIGNGGTRPTNDAFEIFQQAEDANITSSDELVINVFFVEVIPGTNDSQEGENTVRGISLDGDNGVIIHIGDELVGFDEGRLAVARTTAHEIAHNLGLIHVSDSSNLMTASNITKDALTSSQAETIIDSRFSR